MVFTTTPVYALAAALIWCILWLRVTAMRAATGRSIGDGGDARLLQSIRRHGNGHEWATFILTLMMLAEGMGTPVPYLHASGCLLILGRIAHPFGLQIENGRHPLRYVGNGTNMLAALIAMGCIAAALAGL